MRLRRVMNQHGIQVEAKADDYWVALADLEALDKIEHKYGANLSTDLLAVLELGTNGWSDLQEELSKNNTRPTEHSRSEDSKVIIPYEPKSFRDFMLYEEHVINSTRGYVKRFMPAAYRVSQAIEWVTRKPFKKFRPHHLWYKQPIYYFSNHLNFITESDSIVWPSHTKALDYELELGAILTKPLFNASSEEAKESIGGYVVLNDVSARDVQKNEMESGFGPQRAKHFINGISAEVVTADEAQSALENLIGSVSINGKKVSSCNATKAHFSISEAIAFTSTDEQLHSGELFGTGTLPGGSGLENGHWISPGDTLRLEIDGIGSLSNTIESSLPR